MLLSLLVLGVIAREQSNRALLAEKLRQARALESHWVRLAEARLLSRDSFEAGENVAWQALLDPEQALVDEQIEGVGGDGPLSTSPAYWALWEMYMRMPIVASLPLNMPNSIALSEDGFLIAARDRAIEVWEWQTGRLADRLELPIAGVAYSFTHAVGLDTLLVVDTAGPPLLVDLKAGTSVPLGSEPVAAAMTGGACVALSALNDAGVRVEIWDVSTRPPSRTVAVQLADMHFAACFDPAGRFMTVAEVTGRVRVFNTVDGRVLLDRSPAESPRFNRVLSRGRPDEVILVGPDAWAVLQLGEQPVVRLEEDRFRNLNVQNAPKNAWPSRAGKRYIFLTDRWQLGISGANDDEIQGRIVPGLSLRGAALTADDRYVAVLLEGSHRCMLMEAEQAQPRPLVHATDAAIFGRATVFDVVFSPDSRSLYTASMDGTVRRYETRADAVEIVSRQTVPGGATRLALHGDDLLVGSHDEGRGDARILRYHADGAVEELLSGQNWICGLISDDTGIVWGLSGGGVLFRIDLESGDRRAVSLQRPTRRVGYRALAHLPEANLLLLATNNRIDTMLLDANTLEEMGPPLNLGSVRQFAVSPTEPSLFATADDDGCIRIWRFTSGQAPKVDLVRTLRAHAGSAFCIAFHPGGRLIASGGGSPESKDVRIWDSLTGRELAALDLFDVGVFDLEFSPDGRFLAAGGEADPERLEEGPQLFLIDMKAAETMIAGNLEYHIRRLTPDSGREPAFAEAMRSWAAKIRSDSAGPPTVEH